MLTDYFRTGLRAIVLSAAALQMAPDAAMAKGLFSPAAQVNDATISNYEVQQRILLLKILKTPGDLHREALKGLIDERLQLAVSKRAGISPSSEDIQKGIDEFAQRVEMSGDKFLSMIQSQGVAAESFADFVRAGLAWRELVRAKYSANVSVSDVDIDRAIAMAGTTGSAEVLISEIFLPMNSPNNIKVTKELAPQIAQLRSVDAFADAARQFSAGPSRDRGGVVPNWVPLENLPPKIRRIILTMKPGQVTEPIEIPNALALFQLRALRETTAPRRKNPTVEYAAYYIAGGRSETALARAAQVRERADTCDDLYGIAQGQPPEALDRDTLPLAEIPTDVALELAKLDSGEISTALTRANGGTLVLLMLCNRNAGDEIEPSRDAIRQTLTSQKLSGFAENFLSDLRANASITMP